MLKSLSLIAALALFTGPSFAHAGELHDPEIAHVAYTAGDIDVKAAEQALHKSKSESFCAGSGGPAVTDSRSRAGRNDTDQNERHALYPGGSYREGRRHD